MHDAEPIGLLIAAVRRRIRQALASHVRRYQLTTQQFWVVVAIYEHPGLSLGELAAHLRMDKPTASRVVFALTSRKLVAVKGDTEDRRRARVYLGPPGAALGKELLALATAVRAALVQGLSSPELTALRLSLRKIVTNMDRFQDSDTTVMPSRSGPGRARRRQGPTSPRTSPQRQPVRQARQA